MHANEKCSKAIGTYFFTIKFYFVTILRAGLS